MPPRIHLNCTIPGCSNPHYATALCRPHYIQRRNAIARAATKPIQPQPSRAAPVARNAIPAAPPAWPIAPVPVLVPPAPPMLPIVPAAPVSIPAAPVFAVPVPPVVKPQ